MSLNNFCFNLFAFMINNLEIVFRHLSVAQVTHYYIIIATRTALNGFAVSNTKSSTASAEKYFVIKRTLFTFRKKFATTNNRRRHYYVHKREQRTLSTNIYTPTY